MNPYVVDSIISPKGEVVSKTEPSVFTTAISPAVAAQVNEAMLEVVTNGTGTSAQINGYTIRGKTGTAQTGAEKDNSWFVGYITIGSKNIVVAVLIEETNDGTATPKARQMFEAAISVLQ